MNSDRRNPGVSKNNKSGKFALGIEAFLLFLFLLPFQDSKAQESSKYIMYQNSYSAFNPGYTGLQSKYFASLSSNFPNKNSLYFFNTETLIYEQKLEKLSSGIGVNVSYENGNLLYQLTNLIDFTLAVNYAYHLYLNDYGILGIGISAGRIYRTYEDLTLAFGDHHIIIDTTGAKTYLNLGLAYKLRNLNFGIGIGEMYPIPAKKKPSLFFNKQGYALNINASFDVKLKGKHTLIPSVYVVAFSDEMLKTDYKLMFDYKQRFWAAGTFSTLYRVKRKDSSLYFSAGIDIHGKYRIGYTQSRNSDNVGWSVDYHELVLALILN
jgi:type IX secretion system PorP/SprF family membrane protein